jgi:hypothetical protein
MVVSLPPYRIEGLMANLPFEATSSSIMYVVLQSLGFSITGYGSARTTVACPGLLSVSVISALLFHDIFKEQ